MPGRPKRKARLLREGKRLPSWGKPSPRTSPRTSPRRAAKVRLARHEVRVDTTVVSRNHEILEGHPSQAPKASPGRGPTFCSTASVSERSIAYHVGDKLARRHIKQLPAALRPGQVVVTEEWDEDEYGAGVFSVVATWCDGGRLKTFFGQEGS